MHLPDDGGSGKQVEEAYKKEFKGLTVALKVLLADKVEKVTVSSRLETTPCVLTTSQFGYSANMERIIKAQAFGNKENAAAMISKKTMEINPRHPIISALAARLSANPEDDVADIAHLLYEAALLNSGFSLDDTRAFASRVTRMVGAAMKLDSLDLLPEFVPTVPEPEPVAAPPAVEAETASATAADVADAAVEAEEAQAAAAEL